MRSHGLEELGPNAMKLVRARAHQVMHQADLRSREQVPIVCSTPSGERRTVFVTGPISPQLALGEEFK